MDNFYGDFLTIRTVSGKICRQNETTHSVFNSYRIEYRAVF